MFAVGSILAKYDHDQLFPVWGFGAKYNGVVRHCFQCGNDVEVRGVQGIMEAYKGVFNTTLTMSFPTVFTEVIRTAAKYAEHEQVSKAAVQCWHMYTFRSNFIVDHPPHQEQAENEGKLSYTILLVLTAGNVEDVQATKQQLINASSVPLSVVIVGIGEKDFKGMEFLDDHDPSIEGGRDITKFVRFNDYRSFNLLTEAVLDEIPDQLVDYFFTKGMFPGEAETVDRDNVNVMPADDDERTVTFLG
jgi:hypothetical protein